MTRRLKIVRCAVQSVRVLADQRAGRAAGWFGNAYAPDQKLEETFKRLGSENLGKALGRPRGSLCLMNA